MGDMLEAVQVWDSPHTPMEDGKEDVLLWELSKLPLVELWRIQWGLSQSDLLQDFPPPSLHAGCGLLTPAALPKQ